VHVDEDLVAVLDQPMVPPPAASGEMCPTASPDVPPENARR